MADPYWRSRPKGRSDGPPNWTESLFAGRSHADREADQNLMLIVAILVLFPLVGLFAGTHALFEALGMQVGFWALPVCAPAVVWLVACGFARRTLRPPAITEISPIARATIVLVLAGVFRLVWPWWADPTARAWHAAHAGLAHLQVDGAPSYPIGIILNSSPLVLGLLISMTFAATVLLAPTFEILLRRRRRREREWPGPPADPEPLRASLLSPRLQEQSRKNDRGRWS